MLMRSLAPTLVVSTALVLGGAAMAASPEENRQVIADYYAAYATGDMSQVTAFFADDIQWHIPGHHPLAGTKRGKEEVAPSSSNSARPTFTPSSSLSSPTRIG